MFSFTILTLVIKLFATLATRDKLEEHLGYGENIIKKRHFLQMVDHFNPRDKRTFSQYYVINSDFIKPRNIRNILLIIGGKHSLDSDIVKRGFALNIAKELDAVIVALEHRHYGRSILPGNYTLDDYATLTSQQALADLLTFKWHFDRLFDDPTILKWITIGGSYGGMLSSWARIKFPQTFYAAVSASAPVQARVSFYEYYDTIKKAYEHNPFGGSTACSYSIERIFRKIDQIYINMTDTAEYDRKLSACQPTESYAEKQNLIKQVADLFSDIVLTNKQESLLNIKTVCKIMLKNIDPWEKIQQFLTKFKCIDPKMGENMSKLKSDKPSNYKSWYYQRCNEFGYFSHCDTTVKCMFSTFIRPMSEAVLCSEIFEINSHIMSSYVRFTNSYYGGRKPNGTRIIYVNSGLDPWNLLGANLTDPTRLQITINVDDSLHEEVLHEPSIYDSKSLKEARKTILSTLRDWVL